MSSEHLSTVEVHPMRRDEAQVDGATRTRAEGVQAFRDRRPRTGAAD